MLRVTAVQRSLQLEGLNLECGTAGEAEELSSGACCGPEEDDEDDTGGRGCEGGGVTLRRHKAGKDWEDASRKELLQQMLATKSLLEKKQKNRRSGAGAWAVTAGEVVNEYDRAQHQAQQSALRKAVLLRQRKNSTAIKMATLERQHSGKEEVQEQLAALRTRLTVLDSQLRESEQHTEKTLQDLEHRRDQDLHLIKDLGGVQETLGGELKGVASDEPSLARSSHGGSLMGSLSSIPSIVISSSEKKTQDKLFGFKVVREGGRLKARNPLHFLDLKLRVSRRHKSSECLSSPTPPQPDRSHSSTPANGSCSDNSSDEESEQQQQQQQLTPAVRTEISQEALQEIEAFKQLIARYFARYPRHDSITAQTHPVLL